MNKKIIAMLLGLALLCTSLGLKAWADANVTGGSDSWGTGDANNKWTGEDGVRVTLVDADTGAPVSEPFDWSDFPTEGLEIYHGGNDYYGDNKKSKMHYLSGENFELDYTNKYICVGSNSDRLPDIIGSVGGANIPNIKRFFQQPGPLNYILEHANVAGATKEELEKNLNEGRYHVLVEPLAFFKFVGLTYALTATECALYNEQLGGALHNDKLSNLTRKNLPASMYLVQEIYKGTPYHILPWNGGVYYYSDQDIREYLGVGQFTFGNTPSVPGNPDYIYRTNTEVVTAVTVSASSDITPDDHAKVTFDIPGVGSKDFDFVVEGGSSQVCWVTWTTPSDPASMPIGVTSTHGTPDKTSINAEIIKLEEQTPPNPLGTDKSNGFVLSGPPADNHNPDGYTNPKTEESRTWTVWSAEKKDDGKGGEEWKFTSVDYTASLSPGGVSVKPTDSVPTAKQSGGGWTMKSGYGISATVTPTVTGLSYDGVTAAQTAIATFPEFGYAEYNRILEKSNGSFTFRVNPYSMRGDPIHFTPVWYPDKTAYPVHFELRDAWTPMGELRVWATSSGLTIQGSVYDDWYVQRGD